MTHPTLPRYRAACHCKAVRFLVAPPDGLSRVNRCNCSLCGMRGAVVVWTWLDGLEIVEGAHMLRLYTFHSGMARHYFCSLCGIYTHHQRRSEPAKYSVNVACIEGVSPFDFADVPVYNGRDHRNDVAGPRVDPAGSLHYTSFEIPGDPA